MADETQDSKSYVSALSTDCIYDDGYVCTDAEEEKFLSRGAQAKFVPATLINAWSVVWQDFQQLQDLGDEQKALHHYKVGFTEDTDHIIVVLRALLMPFIRNGQPEGISSVSFGQSTKYWVSKTTGEVTERKYFK